MRASLLALTVLLVLASLPAGADDHDLLECPSPGAKEVIERDGHTSDIDTPPATGVAWTGATFKDFQVDLSPARAGATALLTTTMTWGIPTNDYDLFVTGWLDSGNSQSFQVLEAGPEETVSILVQHCETVNIEARNWTGVVFIDELELDFGVSGFKDGPVVP